MQDKNKAPRQTGQTRTDRHPGDLQDPPRDQERLQPEEVILDLPDVSDIPGQEFIHPPALGELADTTIASDDEEGVGLFDDATETDGPLGQNSDEDQPGQRGQEQQSMPQRDEERLKQSRNYKGESENREEDRASAAPGAADEDSYSLGEDERKDKNGNNTIGIP